jgi:CRP-like cAMP-binding protein
MAFQRDEVDENGGTLEKSDAVPPWPPAYNAAHYEIASGEERVARHMARAFARDPTRMVSVGRQNLLAEVCRLFEMPDAHQKLTETVAWRMRRLFREERDFWNELASRFPKLLEDAAIKKELRRAGSQ